MPKMPMTAAVFAAVFACAPLAAKAEGEAVFKSELHDFRVVTVAQGLKDPFSMAWLPNGDMLITEKPGRLRIVRNGVLDPTPIPGTPAVRYAGQGGLFEVLPHPDFAKNQLLYITWAKPNAAGTEGTTALMRAKFDGKRLTDVKELFEAKAWSASGPHYAAKLAFDKDGYLFISVGDRGASPVDIPRDKHPAQDLMSHQGKIIRLHDDGRVPKDNPFVGRKDALPEIYSYGHRNPQGLIVHPNGDIFSIEHGPQGGDELNVIRAGRNYGWPVIGYGVNYGGQKIHQVREKEGMEQPLQFWTPAIGLSGLMVYTGDKFPKWKDHVFAGALAAKQVVRLKIDKTEGGYEIEGLERPALLPNYGRIREVRQGPDGFIYIAIDDRNGGGLTPVVRLEPAR